MKKSFTFNKHNHNNSAFTLIELLIVIAIIALLMAILIPALTRAKEQGKRAVCLNQIKQMQMAWNMYTDENEDKIPSADIRFSWQIPNPPTGPGPQPGWYEWPHQWEPSCPLKATGSLQTAAWINDKMIMKEADWQHSINDGKLYKYLKDFKIYQCPVGDKGERVTYTMVHSLNTYPGSAGANAPIVRLKSKLARISERVIFLDEGAAGAGAFFIGYTNNPLTWGDTPPIRHGRGTTFSFGDGHASYRKWTDKHTLEYIKCRADDSCSFAGQTGDNSDCDLRWMVRMTWGKVLWPNPTSGKHCDEF